MNCSPHCLEELRPLAASSQDESRHRSANSLVNNEPEAAVQRLQHHITLDERFRINCEALEQYRKAFSEVRALERALKASVQYTALARPQRHDLSDSPLNHISSRISAYSPKQLDEKSDNSSAFGFFCTLPSFNRTLPQTAFLDSGSSENTITE